MKIRKELIAKSLTLLPTQALSPKMVSDLTQPNAVFSPPGAVCRTPHALGNRNYLRSLPSVPPWSTHKAQYEQYAKIAIKH
jgi:hypothetical protein